MSKGAVLLREHYLQVHDVAKLTGLYLTISDLSHMNRRRRMPQTILAGERVRALKVAQRCFIACCRLAL